MTTRFLRPLIATPVLVLPLLAALAGCDDSDAPVTTSLAITPSLGLVRNATVVVKTPAGTVVGSGTTGTDGTLTLTASGQAPFVIEVQGDADAEYFDEHTGLFEPFRAPRKIRAMVPYGTTNVGVTGLTDVAASLLEGSSAPITNGNIDKANKAVLDTFASAAPAGLTDLLTPPRVLSSAPTAGYLTANAADMYAAILAGLAATGGSAATPALTAIEQLRLDVSDGMLDGLEGAAVIPNRVYAPGTFASDFASKVSNYVGTAGNAALQTAVSSYTITALVEPTWATGGGGGGGGGTTTPATVNPALAGAYSLVFHKASNVSAAEAHLVDGQSYQVTVSSSGSLMITGRTYTQPFYRSYGGTPNTHEVIWLASDIGIEYALSDNVTPNFNEINVGDASQADSYGVPKFLGQLRAPAAGPDLSVLTALAGSKALKVTQRASTFSNVSAQATVGTDITFNIAANGAVTSPALTNGFDPTAAGTTYADNRSSIEPNLQLRRIDDKGTADTLDDTTFELRIYVEGSTVLGVRYSEFNRSGQFSVSESYLVSEMRPVPANHQAWIDGVLAVAPSPTTFTVIESNNTGTTLGDLCATVLVSASTASNIAGSPLRLTVGSFDQYWFAQYARISTSGNNSTLRFQLYKATLDGAGHLTLEELWGASVAAKATNDPAAISAAGCNS